MLGDLPGPVRVYHNSNAFADIIFDYNRFTFYIEEETVYMKKLNIVLFSGIFIVLLFGLGTYFYRSHQAKNFDFMARENASIFVREYSQTLGSDDAKVYLIKFSDPACETCSAFHPFVKKLMVIRYAPFHDGADYFVKILEAAKKQGKYWETLDVMYRTQRQWASHQNPQPQLIWRLLPRAGLDIAKIRLDMTDPAIEKMIQQDLADAKALNVRKTPGFFVNGKPLISFGYQQLQDLIETEISEKY
jgi:hypothetical protein